MRLTLEAGLDRPLSDNLPLRTSAVWGGWRDVRVLAAIERALESGQPQRLDPLPKRQGPTREQVRSLPLAQVPEYVNTKAPLES